MNAGEIISAYKTNFAPFVRPYYREPLVVDRAKGVHLWDIDGKKYLDAYSAVATVSFGHCNERIDSAVKRQMDRFGHISYIYEAGIVADYSKRLLEKFGKYYSRLFFVNSGSEAVDLAVIIARAYCQSETLFTLSEGYHGGTFLSKFATGLDTWHAKVERDDNIVYISTPECLSCAEHCHERSNALCLEGARERFAELNSRGKRPILLLEPVLGVGGILTPPVHYFRHLAEMIDEYNVFLICDEVQTGFGRCGGAVFGFQKYGLAPHIVCMGKAIANGYPLAGVVFCESIAPALRDMLHFNTFGGNPLSIAAANEVLGILEETSILRDVEENGAYFLKRLRETLEEAPGITDIRGVGYAIGIETENNGRALEILENCRNEGLLVGLGGRDRNVVRIQPALVFSREDCDEAVEMIKRAAESAAEPEQ